MNQVFIRIGAPLVVIALLGSLSACSRGFDPRLHTEVEKNAELEYGAHGTREIRQFVPGQKLKTEPVYDRDVHEATLKALGAMKLDQPTNYYVNQFGDAGLAVEDISRFKDGYVYSLRHPESNLVYRVTLVNNIYPTRASGIIVETLQPVAPGSRAQQLASLAKAEVSRLQQQAGAAKKPAGKFPLPEKGKAYGIEPSSIAGKLAAQGELTGFEHLGHKSYIWVRTAPDRQARFEVSQNIDTDRLESAQLLNEFRLVSRSAKG